MEVHDQLTKGKRKAVRVHIAIIDYFTQILRDLLSCKIAAKDLYKNNVLGKYKTSDKTWEDIFERDGHLELIKKATDYAEFDITLLYQLLRNFCKWTANEKPTSGWGSKQMPATGEKTVGDDIERIRLLRNKFYGHISTFEISDQEYEDCWTIISDVCKRMENRLTGSSYCQKIKNLEKQQLDLDSFEAMKKYIDNNTEDMVNVVTDQHKEVMASLQSVKGELKSIKGQLPMNPPTETEKMSSIVKNERLSSASNKVHFIAAAVFVVMIAVFTSIVVEHGNKGKTDYVSLFIIIGMTALIGLIALICILPVYKLGVSKKRNRHNRGILNDSNLADLAKKLGKDYVLFLCDLNLSMSEIEQIQLENPNNVAMQVVKGLALWRDKEQDRNFEDLVKDFLNALESIERSDLVHGITERNKCQVTLRGCRKEKNDLTIGCDISSTSDLSFSVMWKKDGSKIHIDGRTEKYRGGNQSDLSLTVQNFEDDYGCYQCSVTSVMGTVDSNILNLNLPKVRLTGPSVVNIEECAILIADYSSDIKIISYTWQRKAAKSTYTPLDIDEDKYTGSSIDKLVINGAKLGDGAEYRLLVENILGGVKSNEIQLMVKDIFGKKELWKSNDKYDGITEKDRLKLYRKLFWNKKEKAFSCTVKELLAHLNLSYQYENLECQDDNTDFDSEDSEKMTLWDFLHEKGDISNNIKFWFAKSSDNSIIERYCVSPEYSRREKEIAICIPSEFLPEFVKKIDINISKHRTMSDDSIYPCVSDILNIPTEILYSGDDAVQSYLKQLSKGTVKIYHALGMIVGCAGAGKTTLLKKLKELSQDIVDTESTRGVNIQADVFTVSGKEISVTQDKVSTHLNIIKSTTTTMETVSDKQEIEYSSDENHTNLIESGLTNEQENTTNKWTNGSNHNYLEKRVEKEALRESDDALRAVQEKPALEPIQIRSLLSAIKDDTQQTISIFDFSGRCAYYVTHQIYLYPRAFYVLVIDMTKDLDGIVKEEAVFIRWTYKELIQHWMKMIHAKNRFARVLLVATHAERKSKEEIKNFFVHIWNLIPKDIQKCHLDHKHEFAVELGNSFGIVKIKDSILDIVSTTEQWGEVRPSSWVMFENYLMNAKMKIKVMKLEDLWTENKKLSREYQLEKKDDMKRMLQFFHDTGTILYFDEDVLRDDIILDAPWFVDAFKHIITDSEHVDEDLARIGDTSQKALDDLKQSGILSVSLVRDIWKIYENLKSDHEDAYSTYIQNMQKIMRYMEKLGMIAKITTNPEEIWYVPCMNKRLFLEGEFKEYSVSSTVCFKFNFLPPSIYCRLVASCINLLDCNIPHWPKPEYFHKNAVLVYKKPYDHNYFLIGSNEHQNIIEIQVLTEKGFEVVRFNSINFKNEITNQLGRLRKTFHTNLDAFEIGYRCKNTIFSNNTAAHFIPESEFKTTTIKCPKCTVRYRITCEDVLFPWTKEREAVGKTDKEKIRTQKVTFILETSLLVPGVYGCCHISCVSPEAAWVCDRDDRLRLVNKNSIVIKTVSGRQTAGYGSHTVRQDGEILFIDSKNNHVYGVAGEVKILSLETDQCKPLCIFSSPLNGDLLIGGEYSNGKRMHGVVMRYNAIGDTCLQMINTDETGCYLFQQPMYITENINGDVIVSDWNKVVVVDKAGKHRFHYTKNPSGSELRTLGGVCTDTSGRILLCVPFHYSVHILTRDGEFLSLLQTKDHGITPLSICMDDEQRLWVVDQLSDKICIYRYSVPQ